MQFPDEGRERILFIEFLLRSASDHICRHNHHGTAWRWRGGTAGGRRFYKARRENNQPPPPRSSDADGVWPSLQSVEHPILSISPFSLDRGAAGNQLNTANERTNGPPQDNRPPPSLITSRCSQQRTSPTLEFGSLLPVTQRIHQGQKHALARGKSIRHRVNPSMGASTTTSPIPPPRI